MYIYKYIQVALIRESNPYTSMFMNFKRASQILYGYVSLIIESSFMLTNYSFTNRVAHKLSFIEPSPGELMGSFVCLQP
jgi:hypothetical protein